MSKNSGLDYVKVNYNGNGNKIGIDMIDFNPLSWVKGALFFALGFVLAPFAVLYFVTGDWAVALSGLVCVLGILIASQVVVCCFIKPVWVACRRLGGWFVIFLLLLAVFVASYFVIPLWGPEFLSVVSNFL